MSAKHFPSLAPEVDPTTVVSLGHLLARDLRNAVNVDDLQHRLAKMGYRLANGYLVTLPHGKRICPVSRLYRPAGVCGR